MVDNSDKFHLDPDKARKVELCHQPPAADACASRSSTWAAR
jgi:hypothetical protein